MRRREFISMFGAFTAAVTPAGSGHAQQLPVPVVASLNSGASDADRIRAFRAGLGDSGFVDGQNVMVEYHWLNGQFDHLSELVGDIVRRRIAVIDVVGVPAALAAKAATATVPIVFGVGEDPVKLGLVASIPRRGGNATGVNFFSQEINAKRLELLHKLLPNAVRIAVLVNPTQPTNADTTVR